MSHHKGDNNLRQLALRQRPQRPTQVPHIAFALVLLLGGCAASKDLIERQSTTLAKANLGPDTHYAVALVVAEPKPHSMHGGLVAPLAIQIAGVLQAEIGVHATAVDHADQADWMTTQRSIAQAAAPEERSLLQRVKRDRTSPYAAFFRQQGYQGVALFTFDETTDGFSRNPLDYSLRGTLALHAFVTTDEGDADKLLAKVAVPPTICSRRLNEPPKHGQMEVVTAGYYLSNPERCLQAITDQVRTQVKALVK